MEDKSEVTTMYYGPLAKIFRTSSLFQLSCCKSSSYANIVASKSKPHNYQIVCYCKFDNSSQWSCDRSVYEQGNVPIAITKSHRAAKLLKNCEFVSSPLSLSRKLQ